MITTTIGFVTTTSINDIGDDEDDDDNGDDFWYL